MSYENKRRYLLLSLGLLLLITAGLLTIQSGTPDPVQAAAPMQEDHFIAFTDTIYEVFEGEDATITVSISPVLPAGQQATVNYRTLGVSAVPGQHYVETQGTLTFTAGANGATQSFVVETIRDGQFGPTRVVNLVLQDATNAQLGTPNIAQLRIINLDPTPVPTPTPTVGGPPIFADQYEPNNTLQTAYTFNAAGSALCQITLWPRGDIDYFRFFAKANTTYDVFTDSLSPGLDTLLTLYGPTGNFIAENDDYQPPNRRSQVRFTSGQAGYYYVRVVNQDPSDPANKTYCLDVNEIQPTPTPTSIPGDDCEFNSTLQTACTIAPGQVFNADFVPVFGSLQDTDFYRLWAKAGVTYTCETFNLSPFADTNMIFLDQFGGDFNPQLGNEDKDRLGGDFGSMLTWRATYTGWLHIMVGPVNPPPYEESHLHTYDIRCDIVQVTPTPTPTNTLQPLPPGTGPGTGPVSSPTPALTPEPSITPIDFSFLTPSPTPEPPVISFQPLPTGTPMSGGPQNVMINVTLYYDTNNNFTPDPGEGVQDVAVALYENASGRLLAFGYTNEAGMVSFDGVTAAGPVRVVVPFLNYSQIVVGGQANILLRIAPQPLPIGVP
jgi:hypothetical protein